MNLPEPIQKPNGKWLMRVMVGKKRMSKQFDTQQEAFYWAAGIKTQQREEEKKKKDLPLSQAFDQYINARTNILSPVTIKSYQNIRSNYFNGIMNKRLSTITKEDIQNEINILAKDKSHKTIRNALALLLSVLSDTHQLTLKKFTLPPKDSKEHAFLEGPDIARLIDAIKGDRVEIPVLLALWLGLRRSEICALDWEDFDMVNKTVKITKALVPDTNNKFVIKKTTKTEKSKRVLNLPDYVITRMLASESDPAKRTGKITTMYPNDIYNHLKVICDNNKIPFVGIHGLRHTNASVMLSIGLTAKMAMARGGWSSNKTMQDIYQHLFSEDKTKADQMVNDYFDNLIKGQSEK